MLSRSNLPRFAVPCILMSASHLAAQSTPSKLPPGWPHFPPTPPGLLRPGKPVPPQVAYVPIGRFKLLDSSTGWASTAYNQLLWTTDGGAHWKDISPPNPNHDSYADVFFLNDVTGWVLFSHEVSAYHRDQDPIPHNFESDWTFYVAATHNAGATWTAMQIPAMVDNPGGVQLGGTGHISFADPLNGWAEVDHSLTSASLLHTADGGRTWQWVKSYPGMSGGGAASSESVFVFGSSLRGEQFYASWNAGWTFQPVTFRRPNPSVTVSSYGIPVLQDSRSGYESVTYSAGSNMPSVAVLYGTSDGGHSWRPAQTLTNLAPGTQRISSTVADSSWIVPSKPRGRRMSLVKAGVSAGYTVAPENQIGDFDRCSLSFFGPALGWSNCGLLSSTDDGGATWTVINPEEQIWSGALTGAPVSPPPVPPTPSAPGAARPWNLPRAFAPAATPASVPSRGLSQQLGFDITTVPSTGVMRDWWSNSPYYDIGIYLPGSPNRDPDPNLGPVTGPAWVSAVRGYGWGIVPIWFGLQAPCAVDKTNITQFIDSTPASAYYEGAGQAILAEDGATELGLDGSIIYLDIENYDPAACSQAVEAYGYGFVSELHQDFGAVVGVYSSIFDAHEINSQACYLGVCDTPDYFWIERADGEATVWGADHSYSGDLPDSYWPDQARMHQFATNQFQTWDGDPEEIDEDVVDSTIVPGDASKKPLSVEFLPSSVNYQSDPTVVTAIANGTNSSSNNPSFTQGNLVGYADGGLAPFAQIGGTQETLQSPPVSPTYPTGINDLGTIVGYYQPPVDGPIDAAATGGGNQGIIWTNPTSLSLMTHRMPSQQSYSPSTTRDGLRERLSTVRGVLTASSLSRMQTGPIPRPQSSSTNPEVTAKMPRSTVLG